MIYTEEYLAEWDDHASKAAEAYAELYYEEKIHEQMAKDSLAAIKIDLAQEHKGASQTELESMARASMTWKLFRKEQFEVMRKVGKARIKYDNAQRRWETARSALAMRRAEMGRIVS